MKQLRVLLFAGVRASTGTDFVDVSLPENPTASQVLAAVAAKYPDVADLIRISRLAVDGQYVAADHVINQGVGEVALIPPVSGG
jgi:molybdopterin converting factor small subunit